MDSASLQLAVKSIADRIIAAVMLVLLSPLFLLVAIAIKLESKGDIFFRQDRLGKDGKVFSAWKFRSMVQDADKHLDEMGRPIIKSRVTRVGKIIRKLSIDELPQFINILVGEMSLIGPRAVILSHLDRYTPRQRMRLRMKPGITGLAQIKGRNSLRWTRRIKFDNFYIEHYSLCFDLWIAFRTVKVVLFGEGVVMDRNIDDVDDLPRPQKQVAAVGERK